MTPLTHLAWTYLPVAFVLGGLHALEPGHGKSLASAYLITGKHGKADAVVLGLATTFSHTAVVLLLAAASLWLNGFFPQARIERWVAEVGAGTLLVLGAWVSFRSIRDLQHGHSHGHDHGKSHGHGHGHDHEGREGLWGVALIGLGNGLLPCPGALAALLVALSLGEVALGLATVFSYSLGLAAAMVVMCLAFVSAGAALKARLPSDAALLWLPLVSGVLVFGTGLWLLLA